MGLPTSVFSFGKTCHCGNFFKNQCQGYKGVERSFLEKYAPKSPCFEEKKSEAIIFRQYIHKNKAEF